MSFSAMTVGSAAKILSVESAEERDSELETLNSGMPAPITVAGINALARSDEGFDPIISYYFSDVPQDKIMSKIIGFLEVSKTLEGADPEGVNNLIEKTKKGLCFGYSVCFAAFFYIRQEKWWFETLKVLSSWDMKPDSLKQSFIVKYAEGQETTLEALFNLVTKYLFPYQSHHLGLPQSAILAPAPFIHSPYFKLTVGTEIRTIQDAQVLMPLLGKNIFDAEDLDKILDAATLNGKVIFLRILLKGMPHSVLIGCRDEVWHYYNPTLGENFIDADKGAIIKLIDAFHSMINQMKIVSLDDPIVLTEAQRKYAGLIHFVKKRIVGEITHFDILLLFDHAGIRQALEVYPDQTQSFLVSALTIERLAVISQLQKIALYTLLKEIVEPRPDIGALMDKLCPIPEIVRASRISTVFAEHKASVSIPESKVPAL